MAQKNTGTYRLQARPEFDLQAAAQIVPYLERLGISEVYLSPTFTARPGSSHGYDVLDMNQINPELGGQPAYDRLCQDLRKRRMGLVQDIVPNHCAFHGANPLLRDVLELGPLSSCYHFFDVLWDHPYANIRGRILAPFLGDFYARCLDRGEITLGYGERGFFISYYDFSLPVRMTSYAKILSLNLKHLRASFSNPNLSKLLALVPFINNLGSEIANQPGFDFAAFIKAVLWEVHQADQQVKHHIDHNTRTYNNQGEQARGYELLDELLHEQYFRLAYWKVGTEELNYRRFFSINELIALRMEDESVFNHTHQRLFRLITDGKISGVRVDHIDGLYDPMTYLQRLRERFGELFITVEKILEPAERLPADWPVQGTTGYDFLNFATGVLCDKQQSELLDRVYGGFVKQKLAYRQLVLENKRNIVTKHMAGDIDNLALLLKQITSRSREGTDLTMHALRQALVEVLTIFPIYRTYLNAQRFDPGDREVFRRIFIEAMDTAPYFQNELRLIGTFIDRIFDGQLAEEERRDWTQFVMRLQQYTSPLMAKGLEDTTFYQYNRLLARNDVGTDPLVVGYSVDEFHAFNRHRFAKWPRSLNTLATHDTKRGEDARARLAVLSAEVELWRQHLVLWHKLNKRHKKRIDKKECPTHNDEYFIYQAILGSAPFAGLDAEDFRPRLKQYLVKAAREAKRETSWINPNLAYEEALTQFAARILDPESGKDFLQSFVPYSKRIASFGICNSLSQSLLKYGCPGIPDTYQGTELWDLSFVDPDNRRPVDYQLREGYLQQIRIGFSRGLEGLLDDICATPEDGRIKLYLIHRLLTLRRQMPTIFDAGSYEPILASGEGARHVIAFVRVAEDDMLVVVATRFLNQLQREPALSIDAETWRDTRLRLPWTARPQWTEQLTGARLVPEESLALSRLTGRLPVALLTNW